MNCSEDDNRNFLATCGIDETENSYERSFINKFSGKFACQIRTSECRYIKVNATVSEVEKEIGCDFIGVINGLPSFSCEYDE